MVKITYNPIKEIIIDEIIKYDAIEEWEKIFLPVLIQGGQVALRWAEGVLFQYNVYPYSEATLEYRVKGILHVADLQYALMSEYTDTRTLEPQVGGTYPYLITDVSKTENQIELVKWLKEYDKSLK